MQTRRGRRRRRWRRRWVPVRQHEEAEGHSVQPKAPRPAKVAGCQRLPPKLASSRASSWV
jgi:hypothetical protein